MAIDLAIGFFDGVHQGHRRILAKSHAALTFVEHPLSVLAPARSPKLLMSAAERQAAVAAALAPAPPGFAGPRVRALPFTPAFAAEPPAVFAEFLRRTYPALGVVRCGPNWTFGAGGAGDAAFLRAHGFAVETEPFAEWDGAPVSSTRIRAALAAGDLVAAHAMLGAPYAVEGLVRPGKGRGRALGFPTLNVTPANPACPLARGAYAVETPLGPGVANFGVAPTMGARAWTEPVMEVHLFAAPSTPVPARLAVTCRAFLRAERAFASEDALRAQLAADVAQGLDFFRKGNGT